MNADERNLLAELNAAVYDDGEDGGPSTGSKPARCRPRPVDAARRRAVLASY